MTVRDLGYRPYQGERLPASQNTRVMLRHALRRAWGSWLVKIALFLSWVPPVVAIAGIGIRFYIKSQAGDQVPPLDAPTYVHGLYIWQLWLFISLITLGAGASAIAEDLNFKAFQFYFAKPVTPVQYLISRIGAVSILSFSILVVPGTLLLIAISGTIEPELRLESVALILPAVLHAAVISVVLAIASVTVSSFSKSRAFTMSGWILVFLVPHVLASIVFEVSDWPWLRLISLPALLEIVGDAVFKIEPSSDLRWFHALPILVAVCAGGLTLSHRRLRDAKVIT